MPIKKSELQQIVGAPFYTKRGQVTRYGLACGYLDKWTDPTTGVTAQIGMTHESLDVKALNLDKRLTWVVLHDLKKARQIKAIFMRGLQNDPYWALGSASLYTQEMVARLSGGDWQIQRKEP